MRSFLNSIRVQMNAIVRISEGSFGSLETRLGESRRVTFGQKRVSSLLLLAFTADSCVVWFILFHIELERADRRPLASPPESGHAGLA
jgi:hypothetical protein